MQYGRLTIALATAGAGVICLAPGASADTTTTGVGTVGTPGSNLSAVPCIKVGLPGVLTLGVVPCVKVGTPGALLGVNPCIKVGAPALPGVILGLVPCIKVGSVADVAPTVTVNGGTNRTR
jgi:hypothetical protein